MGKRWWAISRASFARSPLGPLHERGHQSGLKDDDTEISGIPIFSVSAGMVPAIVLETIICDRRSESGSLSVLIKIVDARIAVVVFILLNDKRANCYQKTMTSEGPEIIQVRIFLSSPGNDFPR